MISLLRLHIDGRLGQSVLVLLLQSCMIVMMRMSINRWLCTRKALVDRRSTLIHNLVCNCVVYTPTLTRACIVTTSRVICIIPRSSTVMIAQKLACARWLSLKMVWGWSRWIVVIKYNHAYRSTISTSWKLTLIQDLMYSIICSCRWRFINN